MKRRNLLKGLGVMAVGAVLPARRASGSTGLAASPAGDCWLTPAETEGPFYFNANLIRQDIRTDVDTGEYHDGLPLQMTISVINPACIPIPNVLVDIWHCDKDGVYSGYVNQGHNEIGEDYMRGIQPTDSNGQCSFITSYPGWYPGRATHVHFKVRINSTIYVTSQWAFLDSVNNTVHQTPLYAGRGINPTTNSEDGIFGSATPLHQIMDCVPNEETGGYDGTFTIGIAATVDVEDSPAGVNDRVALRGNYPHPFKSTTTIRYFLPARANVNLTVFDVMGRRVVNLVREERAAGDHEIVFDASRLESGYYIAKIEAGGMVDSREMLLLK